MLKCPRGFTLVETMIALLLFSVALLGIASLATVAIKANYHSKQMATATTLAQQKLEEFINKGYVNLSVGTENEPYGEIKAADGTVSLYSAYRRVSKLRHVNDEENKPVDNMLLLTVTVFINRDAKQVSLSTIIAK